MAYAKLLNMKKYSLHNTVRVMLPLVMAACASVDGGKVASTANQVVILYLSDLHSQLVEGPDNLGGYARLQTLIKNERAAAGPHTDVVVVLGGDVLGKGRMPCRVTNEVKCAPITGDLGADVVAFGNGELKMGINELSSLASKIGGTWIASNVAPVKGQPFWKTAALYQGPKSGLKINFTSTTLFPGPGEAQSGPRLDFVEKSAPFAKIYAENNVASDAATFVIVHDDEKRVDELARELCSQERPPLLVLKAHEHKVAEGRRGCLRYVEADSFGRKIARIELVRRGERYVIQNQRFLEVNSAVPADPAMEKKITALYDAHGRGARKVVVETKSDVNQDKVGRFVALAYQRTSKADIAIVNSGAIKEGLPKGKVDWETVLTAVPYNNQLVGLDWSLVELEKSLCQASRRERDRRLDNGSDLIMEGAELVNAGKDNCRLTVKGNKKLPKVVIDSYMQVRSARWLGRELKGKTFSYGLDTERALELGLERYGRQEF